MLVLALFSLIGCEGYFKSITPLEFSDEIKNNNKVLVRFFSNHREQSSRTDKDYYTLYKSYKNNNNIRLLSINCGKYSSFCIKQGIYDLPVIRYYNKNNANVYTAYSGGFSWESLTKWVGRLSGEKPAPVKEYLKSPNSKTFRELVQNHKCVLSIFHTPWCSACKKFIPRINRLAHIFSKYNNVAFAEVDVDRYRDFIRDHSLRIFPEIRLYINDTYVTYSKKVKLNLLTEYLNENCGTKVSSDELPDEFGLSDAGNTLAEEFVFDGKKYAVDKMKMVPEMSNYYEVFQGIVDNGYEWLAKELPKLNKKFSSTKDPKEQSEVRKKINIMKFVQELKEYAYR